MKRVLRYSDMGLVLIVIVPMIFYLGRIIMMQLYGFDNVISREVKVVSTIDFLITVILVFLFLLFNKELIYAAKNELKNMYVSLSSRLIIYFLNAFFLVLAIYSASNVINIILSGATRQEVFNMLGGMPFFLQLADKYFLILVSFILFTGASRKLKLFSFFCFIVITLIMTSRANLLFFALVNYILLCLNLKLKDLKKIFYLVFFVVLISIILGIFVQKRVGDAIFLGYLKPIEDLLLYQGYSLYLAMVSIDFARDGEKYIFPFLGYLSEYFYRLFDGRFVVDSDFIMQFHSFRSSVRQHSANVIYPWWSWFYGVYGFTGLFLKAFYILTILAITLRKRNFPVFLLFLYWFLYASDTKHPLITLDSYMMLAIVLFLTFFSRLSLTNSALNK